jgi:hypothetical protein
MTSFHSIRIHARELAESIPLQNKVCRHAAYGDARECVATSGISELEFAPVIGL